MGKPDESILLTIADYIVMAGLAMTVEQQENPSPTAEDVLDRFFRMVS